MDHKIHGFRISYPVVSLKGNKLNDIVLGKLFHRIKGNRVILCSVEDQQFIRIINKLDLFQIGFPDFFKEGQGNLYFSLMAQKNLFSLHQLIVLTAVLCMFQQGIMHVDSRTPKGDLHEGISVLVNIFQHQKAAEAGCIDIDTVCSEMLDDILSHKVQVGTAFGKDQFLSCIGTVAGKIKANHSCGLVFGDHLLCKSGQGRCVLITSESVEKYDHLIDLFQILAVDL